MMDEDRMTPSDPMDRLGHKIDALTKIVNAGFSGVETRLTGIDTRLVDVDKRLVDVETGLSGVETRLGHVESGLTDVQQGLAKVQELAERTDQFAKNVWDSLTSSLSRNVDEGFKEAKKDREGKFDLVHKAIRHWGRRVETLETAPSRTPRRRR